MMASKFLSKATPAAQGLSMAARPTMRAAGPQRQMTRAFSNLKTPSAFQPLKRTNLANARTTLKFQPNQRRNASELATALITASQNNALGSAAIGLSGAGVGIGIVFGALILGAARNPSLRAQLFTYAILGLAFSEATGLFAMMMGFLAKYV